MKKLLLLVLILASALCANSLKESIENWEKECSKSNAEDCLNLGMILQDGIYKDGVYIKADKNKAIESYKLACSGGMSKGCLFLGMMFEKGNGIKRDELKATKQFEKACAMGNQTACGLMKYRTSSETYDLMHKIKTGNY